MTEETSTPSLEETVFRNASMIKDAWGRDISTINKRAGQQMGRFFKKPSNLSLKTLELLAMGLDVQVSDLIDPQYAEGLEEAIRKARVASLRKRIEEDEDELYTLTGEERWS